MPEKYVTNGRTVDACLGDVYGITKVLRALIEELIERTD